MVVFLCPFHMFMPLSNLWYIRLQGYFPILRARNFPGLYPLVLPPIRLLTFGRGRILIPALIRSLPTVAVYDVARSLPLGGASREFTFTEDGTRRHFSYFFGRPTFFGSDIINIFIFRTSVNFRNTLYSRFMFLNIRTVFNDTLASISVPRLEFKSSSFQYHNALQS